MRTCFTVVLVVIMHCELRAQWVRDTVIRPIDGSYSMVTLADTIYISSDGTILRSTDEGMSWQPSGNGLTPGVYYPFSGTGPFFLTRIAAVGFPEDTNYGKLFRSIDAGETWNQVNAEPHSIDADAVIAIADTLYASGYVGLFRSIDSGATWNAATTVINSGSLARSHTNCFLSFGTMVFAGCDSGIFVTKDRGETWSLASARNSLLAVQSILSLETVIFADAHDSLFRSTDSGESWQSIVSPFPLLPSTSSLSLAGGNLLLAAGRSPLVYWSSDGGNTWTFFGYGLDSSGSYAACSTTSNFIFLDYSGFFLWRRPLSDFNGADLVTSVPTVAKLPSPLEIFDVLGRLVYDGPVASKPILSSGLYFEQTGRTVKKVWIP